VLDGGDELVDEGVAGEVEDAGVVLALEHLLADGLEEVGLTEADAAVDEKRVVRLAGILSHRKARRVRQAVAGADDEILERVIRAQDHRLILVVEHPAAGKVVAVETDRDQPRQHHLRRLGEGLLALALAEVELRRRGDVDLDDAVAQLPRRELVKPGSVEARVLRADDLEHFLPGRRIENGGGVGVGRGINGMRAARSGLAHWKRVGR
jgi:hypothetical protein